MLRNRGMLAVFVLLIVVVGVCEGVASVRRTRRGPGFSLKSKLSLVETKSQHRLEGFFDDARVCPTGDDKKKCDTKSVKYVKGVMSVSGGSESCCARESSNLVFGRVAPWNWASGSGFKCVANEAKVVNVCEGGKHNSHMVCDSAEMCPEDYKCCWSKFQKGPGLCRKSCSIVEKEYESTRCDSQYDCKTGLKCCHLAFSAQNGRGHCKESCGSGKRDLGCGATCKKCCESLSKQYSYPNRFCLQLKNEESSATSTCEEKNAREVPLLDKKFQKLRRTEFERALTISTVALRGYEMKAWDYFELKGFEKANVDEIQFDMSKFSQSGAEVLDIMRQGWADRLEELRKKEQVRSKCSLVKGVGMHTFLFIFQQLLLPLTSYNLIAAKKNVDGARPFKCEELMENLYIFKKKEASTSLSSLAETTTKSVNTLRVWVRDAKHLPKTDRFGAGSDPYFKLKDAENKVEYYEFGRKDFHSLNPNWNSPPRDIEIEKGEEKVKNKFLVHVLDYDAGTKDDQVGYAYFHADSSTPECGAEIATECQNLYENPWTTKMVTSKLELKRDSNAKVVVGHDGQNSQVCVSFCFTKKPTVDKDDKSEISEFGKKTAEENYKVDKFSAMTHGSAKTINNFVKQNKLLVKLINANNLPISVGSWSNPLAKLYLDGSLFRVVESINGTDNPNPKFESTDEDVVDTQDYINHKLELDIMSIDLGTVGIVTHEVVSKDVPQCESYNFKTPICSTLLSESGKQVKDDSGNLAQACFHICWTGKIGETTMLGMEDAQRNGQEEIPLPTTPKEVCQTIDSLSTAIKNMVSNSNAASSYYYANAMHNIAYIALDQCKVADANANRGMNAVRKNLEKLHKDQSIIKLFQRARLDASDKIQNEASRNNVNALEESSEVRQESQSMKSGQSSAGSISKEITDMKNTLLNSLGVLTTSKISSEIDPSQWLKSRRELYATQLHDLTFSVKQQSFNDAIQGVQMKIDEEIEKEFAGKDEVNDFERSKICKSLYERVIFGLNKLSEVVEEQQKVQQQVANVARRSLELAALGAAPVTGGVSTYLTSSLGTKAINWAMKKAVGDWEAEGVARKETITYFQEQLAKRKNGKIAEIAHQLGAEKKKKKWSTTQRKEIATSIYDSTPVFQIETLLDVALWYAGPMALCQKEPTAFEALYGKHFPDTELERRYAVWQNKDQPFWEKMTDAMTVLTLFEKLDDMIARPLLKSHHENYGWQGSKDVISQSVVLKAGQSVVDGLGIEADLTEERKSATATKNAIEADNKLNEKIDKRINEVKMEK